jgi:hypothetical protein
MSREILRKALKTSKKSSQLRKPRQINLSDRRGDTEICAKVVVK